MSKYPEHEKLEQVKEQSQACGEFLDWLLSEKRFQVCEFVGGHDNGEERYLTDGETKSGQPLYIHAWQTTWRDGKEVPMTSPNIDPHLRKPNPSFFYTPEGFYPVRQNIESLLAEYFGIDRDKLEAEKREMLSALRAA